MTGNKQPLCLSDFKTCSLIKRILFRKILAVKWHNTNIHKGIFLYLLLRKFYNSRFDRLCAVSTASKSIQKNQEDMNAVNSISNDLIHRLNFLFYIHNALSIIFL